MAAPGKTQGIGRLSAAFRLQTLGMRQDRQIAPARARRDLAILAHAQSLQAERSGQAPDALRFARRGHRLAPDSAPLAARLATLLLQEDHKREAAKIVERTWPLSPQPDLARLYLEARPESD